MSHKASQGHGLVTGQSWDSVDIPEQIDDEVVLRCRAHFEKRQHPLRKKSHSSTHGHGHEGKRSGSEEGHGIPVQYMSLFGSYPMQEELSICTCKFCGMRIKTQYREVHATECMNIPEAERQMLLNFDDGAGSLVELTSSRVPGLHNLRFHKFGHVSKSSDVLKPFHIPKTTDVSRHAHGHSFKAQEVLSKHYHSSKTLEVSKHLHFPKALELSKHPHIPKALEVSKHTYMPRALDPSSSKYGNTLHKSLEVMKHSNLLKPPELSKTSHRSLEVTKQSHVSKPPETGSTKQTHGSSSKSTDVSKHTYHTSTKTPEAGKHAHVSPKASDPLKHSRKSEAALKQSHSSSIPKTPEASKQLVRSSSVSLKPLGTGLSHSLKPKSLEALPSLQKAPPSLPTVPTIVKSKLATQSSQVPELKKAPLVVLDKPKPKSLQKSAASGSVKSPISPSTAMPKLKPALILKISAAEGQGPAQSTTKAKTYSISHSTVGSSPAPASPKPDLPTTPSPAPVPAPLSVPIVQPPPPAPLPVPEPVPIPLPVRQPPTVTIPVTVSIPPLTVPVSIPPPLQAQSQPAAPAPIPILVPRPPSPVRFTIPLTVSTGVVAPLKGTDGGTEANPPPKKKKKKKSKNEPRKVIPLKERSFNPNEHCGVASADGSECKRSLTCKTHSMALRRAVPGRNQPFDTLLTSHKKARDEAKLAKQGYTEDLVIVHEILKKDKPTPQPVPVTPKAVSQLPAPLQVPKPATAEPPRRPILATTTPLTTAAAPKHAVQAGTVKPVSDAKKKKASVRYKRNESDTVGPDLYQLLTEETGCIELGKLTTPDKESAHELIPICPTPRNLLTRPETLAGPYGLSTPLPPSLLQLQKRDRAVAAGSGGGKRRPICITLTEAALRPQAPRVPHLNLKRRIKEDGLPDAAALRRTQKRVRLAGTEPARNRKFVLPFLPNFPLNKEARTSSIPGGSAEPKPDPVPKIPGDPTSETSRKDSRVSFMMGQKVVRRPMSNFHPFDKPAQKEEVSKVGHVNGTAGPSSSRRRVPNPAQAGTGRAPNPVQVMPGPPEKIQLKTLDPPPLLEVQEPYKLVTGPALIPYTDPEMPYLVDTRVQTNMSLTLQQQQQFLFRSQGTGSQQGDQMMQAAWAALLDQNVNVNVEQERREDAPVNDSELLLLLDAQFQD